MINKIFILLILMFFHSCSGQNEKEINTTKKNEKMKKIDIDKFKKNWSKGGAFFSLSDGTKIEQYETDDGFDEIIKKPLPSFLSEYNTYYKDGNLKSSTIVFSEVSVGKSFEYNKVGKIISEKNEDLKFGKIKYTDILKILNEKNHLDLKTGKGWYKDNGDLAISINFNETNYLWTIRSSEGIITYSKNSPAGQGLKSNFYYEIDGNSGKILKE
ncbi:hypothetical protein [Chryseobacterium artocarpi]|nr:hypothetical protein [Chryseobacterium artocarpi]